MNKKSHLTVYVYALVILLLQGCIFEQLDESLSNSERINKFIINGVHTYYLWEAETDWKIMDKRETYGAAAYSNHYKLFDQLRYRDDAWSMLTDDINDMENQFAGVSTTFGYTLSFYYNPITNNKEVIAIILYTTPDSPATRKGLKRGDVIIEMNGNRLTSDNYMNLYMASSLRLRCGQIDFDTQTVISLPEIYDLTAVQMYENPINAYRIIEKGSKKIGYLCYTGFQRESERELFALFSSFKSADVQDIVLDLRYNPGGYSVTAQIFSSILAPASAVYSKSVYLEHHYNQLYTDYIKSKGYSFYETFIDTLPVNMNLSRLYVLTGKYTASASEALMVGLDPYLNIIQIGDTTAGKFCGGVLLSPEDIYEEKNKNYYERFSNWGMYIMIYRYANKNGIKSFAGRLAPEILVEEITGIEDVYNLKPFGDENDPLLGNALAHITGIPYLELRSARSGLPLIPLPAPKKTIDGLLIATPEIISSY